MTDNADRPELDATSQAHPAWWRGHDHTVKVMCHRVTQILCGNETPFGISTEPWGNTRHLLHETRKELQRLHEENGQLRALNDEMLTVLKMVMQHGRIDDSEARLNLIARTITRAEGASR